MFYFLNTVSTISGKCRWRKLLSIKSAWNQNNNNKCNKLTTLYNVRMRPWESTKNWSSKQKDFFWGKGGVGNGCKLVTEAQEMMESKAFLQELLQPCILWWPSGCAFLTLEIPLLSSFINFLFNFPVVPGAHTLRAAPPHSPRLEWAKLPVLHQTLGQRHLLQGSAQLPAAPAITEGICHWAFSCRGNTKTQGKTSTNQTYISKRKLYLI